MAKTDKYTQFPICLLAYGSNPNEQLNAILDFSARYAGRIKLKEMKQLGERFRPTKPVNGYSSRDETHAALVAGGNWIGIDYSEVLGATQSCRALDEFISTHEKSFGKCPLVRIKTSLLFEARDQKGLQYDELCILVAIFSVIGNKGFPVRITKDVIQARALGYKTPRIVAEAIRLRADGASPFKEARLRKLIEILHARKFFARATYARRITYYSHRMSHVELEKAIIEYKTRRRFFRQIRRERDEEMTRKIKEQRKTPPPTGTSEA
jgi:hypothetical protein